MALFLLVVIAALELAILAMLVVFRPPPAAGWIDVPARDRAGALAGGTWEFVAGLGPEPTLPSGALVLEVKSTRVWVHEVWVRTDHGWVQLQPGPGDGTFRNSLVAGLRISSIRLWLARAGEPPDESDLHRASPLLVPAALLLTRAMRTSPVPIRATPPPAAPREG